MADCLHDWKPRPGGTKEDCFKCGAARMIDPNRCAHDWVMRPTGKKLGCAKCGAAKVVLDVHDIKKSQAANSPL
jgi:hypothetical protein